jgi:hypothetical protein
MAGHGDKRARKQAILIASLLSEPTQAEAARKAGVSVKTASRWLKDPDFQEEYRQARMGLVEHTMVRIQSACSSALNLLVLVINSGQKESNRVRAALGLLDRALRLEETFDLHQRVKQLELERRNGQPAHSYQNGFAPRS